MKGWFVRINDCDSGYVLAETRGRATMAVLHCWWDAYGEHETDWRKVRTLREPLIDGVSFTAAPLVTAGKMWSECAVCRTRIQGPHQRHEFGWDDRPVDLAGNVETIWTETGTYLVCGAACMDAVRRGDPRRLGERTYRPGDVLAISTEY